MAAFQFPDPATGETTVTNPITGSTYQWQDPPGKWVVTVRVREVGDIVWEGDNPPDPISDYKLWYSTDTLELYFYYCDVNGTCAWLPTSTAITQFDLLQQQIDEIKNNLDNVGGGTLQEVLENGNIADKSIVLTNASDDALLLSPEEARIMIAGAGDTVVPKIELRHTTGVLDTSLVALELDENGQRFDIECDERVDNIHFRFGSDDKLILNKQGDAVFTGKVKVAEAQQNDEVPTFGQVSAAVNLLQQEIDQIAVTFERGAWNHDDGDGIVNGNEYLLIGVQTQEGYDEDLSVLTNELNACLADSAGNPTAQADCNRVFEEDVLKISAVGSSFNTNDWKRANKITFSPYDLDGNIHSFADVVPGQILDMYCDDGSGFMVAEITKVTAGMWYETHDVEFTPIKTNGIANGKTRVKVFSIDGSVDSEALNDFVRKQGSNTVEDGWKIASSTRTHFHVEGGESRVYWLKDPEHDQQPVTRGYANTNYAGKQYVDDNFALKQYVDDAIAAQLADPAPARYAWTVQIGDSSGEPDAGNILIPNGTVSSRNVIKLSETPTVGAQFYQRTNKMIFEGKFVNNNTERVNPQIFTVWDRSNGKWRWKATCNIHYMQYDGAGNILIDVGDQVHWNKVDEGNTLYINIAGFL